MQKREYLQQHKIYYPVKNPIIGGWYVSELFDGVRCLWDGGLSRGHPTWGVPWAAKIDPKTGRRRAHHIKYATGLWTQYGNPVYAPDWFLDLLPNFMCDGILWGGHGHKDICRGVCGGEAPESAFYKLHFIVTSSPPLPDFIQTGMVKSSKIQLKFEENKILHWLQDTVESTHGLRAKATLEQQLFAVQGWDGWTDRVYLNKIRVLSNRQEKALEQLELLVEESYVNGSRGVVLRNPLVAYRPITTHHVLHYTPWFQEEGRIVGFLSSEKGNGLIGTVSVSCNGKIVDLDRIPNEKCQFESVGMTAYAQANPGKVMPPLFNGRYLKRGATIQFMYRHWDEKGSPDEAFYPNTEFQNVQV